jgi:hypothetical protein
VGAVTEPSVAASAYARWRATTLGRITEAVEVETVFGLTGDFRSLIHKVHMGKELAKKDEFAMIGVFLGKPYLYERVQWLPRLGLRRLAHGPPDLSGHRGMRDVPRAGARVQRRDQPQGLVITAASRLR